MSDLPAPNSPDPALQLPADAYWQLIRTLRLTLPPPPDPNPEALARRDNAAIARVAGLAPVNAAEAELAAQFVAASEQWKDCLRLAQLPATTPECAAKCRAQAIAMMRQANVALRLLLRMQDARARLEANGAAADRAAWSEHRAVTLMAEALAELPAAAPNPSAPPTPESPTPQSVRQPRSPMVLPLPLGRAPIAQARWGPDGGGRGEGSQRRASAPPDDVIRNLIPGGRLRPANAITVSPHDLPSRKTTH